MACSLTLDPLRSESGNLDRLDLSECAALFPRDPGEAFDEADTVKVAHASVECTDCSGLKYLPRRDDLKSFGFKRVCCSVPIRIRAKHYAQSAY